MGRVIAFVPLRGGSKGIPRKNIKLLAGKPLACYVIEALVATEAVDHVVVATDDDEIADTVMGRAYAKTLVYRRKLENAQDGSSTESVMVEFLNSGCFNADDEDIFLLAQATSPLTSSTEFTEAIDMYRMGRWDSLLSCARSKRFFWTAEGKPINYDVFKRPRRQDFDGLLMENGALYISHVGAIRETGNRICGEVGIYEMPEWSGIEIDDELDWVFIENLIQRRRAALNHTGNPIKVFLTDIDGVMTDGGMYYSEQGEELKKFNTKDGMAFERLRKYGIKTGIITGENTRLVERRAKKIGADYLFQGVSGEAKVKSALEICAKEGCDIKNVSYIGDDINCIPLLRAVGFSACPSDSCGAVRKNENIRIMALAGGQGVVREFAEFIIEHNSGIKDV